MPLEPIYTKILIEALRKRLASLEGTTGRLHLLTVEMPLDLRA